MQWRGVVPRPEFRCMLASACQRLVGELRSLPHLLHHMLHLARALDYLYSLGIVHHDLKPENILVRVIDSTYTQVTHVQLVIADFDGAVLYRRDAKKMVMWNEKQKSSYGTLTYSPAVYHSLISIQHITNYRIFDRYRKQQQQQQLMQHRHVDDMYYVYKRMYPHAHPSFDMYSMGLIFLSLIYRHNINVTIALWMKHEMMQCNVAAAAQPASLSSSTCTPAHVLLHHDGPIKHYEQLDQFINSHYYDIDNFPYFAERRRQVLADVKAGIIPAALCDLLTAMTAELPSSRPNTDECMCRIVSIINKI